MVGDSYDSMLTLVNSQDLKRIKKTAVKLIMGPKYRKYQDLLNKLELETWHDRRENLCLKFAQKCTSNRKMKDLFRKNEKNHSMETRYKEKYHVYHANIEKNSPAGSPEQKFSLTNPVPFNC